VTGLENLANDNPNPKEHIICVDEEE